MERVYQWAPLTMGWCVNCHRNDDYVTEFRKNWSAAQKKLKGQGERSLVDQMLSHPDPHNAEVSCSTCHY
jgi:cytochrome c553